MTKLILTTLLLTLSLHAGEPEKIELKTLSYEDINITNYDGNLIIEQEAYKGKDILLFFFGVKCGYCVKEYPQIEALALTQKNLKIIGIQAQYERTDDEIREYVQRHNIDFKVLSFNDGMKIVQHLNERGLWIGGVPYHVLIDKHGNLQPVEVGEIAKKCGD